MGVRAEETPVPKVVEPLGSSYCVESLTTEIEKGVFATILLLP